MADRIGIEDLRGRGIVALVSGGLDSVTFTRWARDHGVKVHCCTADLGQPDEEDIGDIETRMRQAGAETFALVDGRQALAEAGVLLLICGGSYEGGYLNTTGIARAVTTQKALPILAARGVDVLAHGATGRGNDQTRFQLYANMLDPAIKVYAPWRDAQFLAQFPGRSEMIDYCEAQAIPVRATRDKPYSTDANLLGLTHEAGKLEQLDVGPRFITPQFGVHPQEAPDTTARLAIRFESGIPVQVNGQSLELVPLFELLNEVAGANGVGIGIHAVENRYVGIKSRGVYEQPAMQVLHTAYEYIYQLILDRRSLELYKFLANLVGRQIYEAAWFHPSTGAAIRAIRSFSDTIRGELTVDLYKGHVDFVKADFESVLYSPDDASMEGVGTFDHGDAEGLLGVLGVSAKGLHAANQIRLDDFSLYGPEQK